ncbi:unnamed protein product [Closterium sp. Naga37s-1]|nr:unnamed protein product [Closterium sp. Naga37s-1]
MALKMAPRLMLLKALAKSACHMRAPGFALMYALAEWIIALLPPWTATPNWSGRKKERAASAVANIADLAARRRKHSPMAICLVPPTGFSRARSLDESMGPSEEGGCLDLKASSTSGDALATSVASNAMTAPRRPPLRAKPSARERLPMSSVSANVGGVAPPPDRDSAHQQPLSAPLLVGGPSGAPPPVSQPALVPQPLVQAVVAGSAPVMMVGAGPASVRQLSPVPAPPACGAFLRAAGASRGVRESPRRGVPCDVSSGA